MIDIKGQVRVVFHISDWKVEGGHWVNVIDPNFKDFLSFEQLLTFTIIEEAGNVLPTFRLEMKLIEEEIIKRFNEGCVLTMSYGRDDQHMKTSYLRIMRMDTYPVGNIERAVMLRGFVDAMGWLNTTHCDYYPNMTAIEVIQATAGQFFRVDTNGLVSQDRMTWIQPNISFKRFINEVWMHIVIYKTRIIVPWLYIRLSVQALRLCQEHLSILFIKLCIPRFPLKYLFTSAITKPAIEKTTPCFQ